MKGMGKYMDLQNKNIGEKVKAYSDVLWTLSIRFCYKKFNKREANPFNSSKKTRGCHCMLLRFFRGSMTVEASLVTPIFFIAMFSLFYLLQIMFDIQNVQGQLRDAASQYACYGTKFQTVQTLIKEKKVICWRENSVEPEGDGICFVDYKIKVPFLGEKFFSVHLYQQTAVSKYNGKSMIPTDGLSDEEYVYVTVTGKVCHKNIDCSYLKPSIRAVLSTEAGNKRNVSGGKYYACDSCCKGKSASDFKEVFITSYGECFHCKKACPGLKRTVRKVKKSETGLPYCSKCGRD